MEFGDLSPLNRELLREAMPQGELVNVLYRDGERLEGGFARERRCFALGERGWLDFKGFDGAPGARENCGARWVLTHQAWSALASF